MVCHARPLGYAAPQRCYPAALSGGPPSRWHANCEARSSHATYRSFRPMECSYRARRSISVSPTGWRRTRESRRGLRRARYSSFSWAMPVVLSASGNSGAKRSRRNAQRLLQRDGRCRPGDADVHPRRRIGRCPIRVIRNRIARNSLRSSANNSEPPIDLATPISTAGPRTRRQAASHEDAALPVYLRAHGFTLD